MTMGGKVHFDESRANIIKNMDSVDIQAFPGSGKTTLLVAKLAILAKKWPYSNSGICVLSHTNVAREEIEERLGNNEIGSKLLSYPHFIGTVHSFFDTYVTLPWLRSKGYRINIIDTDIALSYRWFFLPRNTKFFLEKKHEDKKICQYKESVGCIDWNKNGKTKDQILSIIEESQHKGYFTFDEMLLYAKQALEESTEIASVIQNRFPVLFIDEAQDTDTFQWELLNSAFCDDGIKCIRQGFGDSNQAIYGSLTAKEELHNFPRENALILNESRRFDSSIAKLANTVAISKAQMNGTINNFSDRKVKHTIFLFKKENASKVIDEFGQLVLDTFTDEELCKYEREGCHVIGMIHVKKEETTPDKFPKGIYDYWNGYEAKKAKNVIRPSFLIEYFRMGINELESTGEKANQIEWVCKGIRSLINRVKKDNYVPASKNTMNALLKLLTDDQKVVFRKLLMEMTNFQGSISMEEWDDILGAIKQILALFDITFDQTIKFVGWIKDSNRDELEDDNEKVKKAPNHYLYTDSKTNRCVDIEFGSIHSVKGRTHLATLVLETNFYDHNMKSILEYLCDTPHGKMKTRNINRLKCQYVAMTRARALICLAIPIDFVDEKSQEKLKKVGWNLKIIE